jgi:hypothetical protein
MLFRAVFTLALALTACGPAVEAPPDNAAHAGDVGETQPANPDAAALGATLQQGAWTFRADEGVFGAGFGTPESEYQLNIACESPMGQLTLSIEHELAPNQDTVLRIITTAQNVELPARSFNEGLPSVSAELADDAPLKPLLIGTLGTPTDRFAVEVAGQISVFPWDQAIARSLEACR